MTITMLSLAAFAELLDNALDEVGLYFFSTFRSISKVGSIGFSSFDYQVRSGATFVNVDMIQNRKDGSKMILIEGIQLILVYLLLC